MAVAAGPPMAVPANAAAEEAKMKTRKAYTITRSRESWIENREEGRDHVREGGGGACNS